MGSPRLRAVFLILALGGICVAAAPGAARSLASNQRAARRDAAGLLRSLRLPADARPSPAEPRGDGGTLKPLPALVATTARADAHAWWTVPGSRDAVLSYVESHPPAGARQTGTGSGCSATCSESVTYNWPAIPAVIGVRELIVTVAPLSGGGTGVLASAESDWIVPRPASEKIPAGVRVVEITSGMLGGRVTGSFTVTKLRDVHRIVSLFDAMPIGQPGTIACPALSVGGSTRRIAFTFRSRPGAPPLAKASYIDYEPYPASTPCNPVAFSVRGRRQHVLIGGDFLNRIETLLGADLAR